MITLLSIAVFLWIAFWAFLAIKEILFGKRHTINFAIIIFFIFWGIPIILDVIIGKPTYQKYPGFKDASNDDLTFFIFSLYMIFIPIFWWLFGRSVNYKKASVLNVKSKKILINCLSFILLLLPINLVFFAPLPELYLNYGATALGLFQDEARDYHAIVSASTLGAIIGWALLLINSNRNRIFQFIILTFPLLFSTIWINGKRYILVLVLLLFVYILWYKKVLIGKRLLITCCIFLLIFMFFSKSYQSEIRDIDSESNSFYELYEGYRVNFGRDDVTKLAIYYELQNDKKILDYRGQSLLFYSGIYIPREIWLDKPYPYAKYVTSAMLNVEPRLWSWGMTTSILEEAIANFSWFGMLIGPLLILLICKKGDRHENIFIRILTLLNAILFLLVHLAAFFPLFIIWVFLLIYFYFYKKRAKVETQ